MDKTNIKGLEVPSIIQSLKPKGTGWIKVTPPSTAEYLSITISAWFYEKERFFVISAVEFVKPEGISPARPEYHLSFSRHGPNGPERVRGFEAKWILKQFRFDGWFEDNHVPHGKVRNYWRPVNENLVGQVCACVDEEPAIKEDKGDYIWRPV